MTELSQGTNIGSDDALERLLKEAPPRPVPSSDDEAAVRSAVHAEWRRFTGRRRRRRQFVTYALAASVLAGVFVVLNTLRVTTPEPVQVATVERSFGPIFMLGESAELSVMPDVGTVLAGQALATGQGAGMALAWGNGGSLRIDENTRVEFTAEDFVYLRSGRVYFDATPHALLAGGVSPGLVIQSDHGRVEHRGTQFMTDVEQRALTVSVREGQVEIIGRFHDHRVSAGEQVTIPDGGQPILRRITPFGEPWSWVARTSPEVDVDGRSLRDFLAWATRELGLELVFEDGAEQVAGQAVLRGSVDAEPAVALRQRLATAALAYRINEGVLYVSDSQ